MRTRTVDPVMLESRAASFTKRSIKASSKLQALTTALAMLDLTTLEGKDTPEKVRSLCRKALRPGSDHPLLRGLDLPSVAAVCVYPAMVPVARDALARFAAPVERPAGTPATARVPGVKVAAVATGFPSGQYPLSVRLEDTRRAIDAGADEIDMVINRGAFLAGRYDDVAQEIREVRSVCRAAQRPVALKVILETGELETCDNIRRASDLALELLDTGDFIKTSTGKVQPAATLPVSLLMLEAIRDCFLATGKVIGMKPAGGIATAKLAIQYLCMVKETMEGLGTQRAEPGTAGAHGSPAQPCPWLTPGFFRFGASSLMNDLLRQIAWVKSGTYMASYDFAEA